MSHPEISVIVPTYNRAQCLPRCIEAILAQDDQNFELIIVDDGSQDETQSLLQKYNPVIIKNSQKPKTNDVIAESTPHILVIQQENRGVSAARNRGILESHGNYLTFCDSDDVWTPRKLGIQRTFFHHSPEALVCYTGEIWIRKGLRVNPCKHHAKVSGDIFDRALALCVVSPSSVMMQRRFFDIVGFFDEDLPACEDYDLWLRAAALQIPFHYIPEDLIVKYGGHDDQLSKKYWGMDRFRVQALLKCLKMPNLTQQQRQQAIVMLIKKCSIIAQGATKRGNLTLANEYEHLRQQWLSHPL